MIKIDILPGCQTAVDPRILEVVISVHVMGTHDPLSIDLIGCLFRPYHHPNLDPFLRLVLQDLAQSSVVNGQVFSTKQLKLVPDCPTSDANDLFGCHDGVIQVMPTRGRVDRQVGKLRQIFWDTGILVQGYTAILVHWEIARLHIISVLQIG